MLDSRTAQGSRCGADAGVGGLGTEGPVEVGPKLRPLGSLLGIYVLPLGSHGARVVGPDVVTPWQPPNHSVGRPVQGVGRETTQEMVATGPAAGDRGEGTELALLGAVLGGEGPWESQLHSWHARPDLRAGRPGSLRLFGGRARTHTGLQASVGALFSPLPPARHGERRFCFMLELPVPLFTRYWD